MHPVARKTFVCAGVAALAIVGPMALADGGPRFTAPLAWGTVDFGDRVLYHLTGHGCVEDPVRVHVGGPGRRDAVGPTSRAVADPLVPGTCEGVVRVPSERAVRRTGWDAGDPVTIRIVSSRDAVPLRYERVEVDEGTKAAGSPTVVRPAVRDPRGGARDKAMSMSTGDVVALGRVDLTHVYSISLRVCVTQPKPHVTPSLMELRAGAPDAPAIVGPVDVADDLNNSHKSNFGWPNCWQLQPWPIANKVPGRDPTLFLAMDATALPVEVSYIDFNGTGAKIPDVAPADPRGARSIFNGRSFKGWKASNCAIDPDGSVRPVHDTSPTNYTPLVTEGFVGESGCSMTYTARKFHNVMVRFEYRMEDFGDNGAVYLGGHEIQLREAGEWMTGGFQGDTVPQAVTQWAVDSPVTGYPAQRIKSNSYPDWSQFEAIQIGGRYIVRINGRTVTDCTNCAPDPGKFNFSVATQPSFSYHYGVSYRMDQGPTNPQMDNPANWGNISFRDFRAYSCRSATDPVCTRVPSVNGLPR